MLSLSAQKQSGQGDKKGSVKLAGRTVEYLIKVSNRAKYLRLQVSGETGLVVITPKGFKLKDLEDILHKRQNWILDKLDYTTQVVEDKKKFQQENGWRIFYGGVAYEVETRVEARIFPDVVFENGKMIVIIPEEDRQVFDVKIFLGYWFRYQARLLINKRLLILSEKLKLSYNNVFIKDQKTRWGSCSEQKNLNFNWRLVMAPLAVLDYVVVHELMHLLELNHSKRFWALVEGVCPDYKAHRDWLKKNGKFLVI